MNIYQKIALVMQDIEYLSKDDHVKFGQQDYKAVSEEKGYKGGKGKQSSTVSLLYR